MMGQYEKFSISQLKKEADKLLRQYLLSIKSVEGRVKCPIKNKWYPNNKVNVSHFIDRACMELRYDLDNCHLLSEQSNMWDSKIPKEGYKSLHHYDYEQYLGKDKVKELIERSKKITILYRADYLNLIKKFKDV